MVHLTRAVIAAILGGLCCLLAGCVLTGLEVGFNLSPPGPYVHLTIGDPPAITTQPGGTWTLASPGHSGGVSGQTGPATVPAVIVTVAPATSPAP